jgi:predicted aspartyl protease
MGTFKVTMEIGDPQAQRFEPIAALVDTGATYTVAPRLLLQRLGVVPHTRATFVLADESQVEYDIGRTWIRYDGQQEIVLVVFGNEGAEPLLGAFTLEAFRLAPDPVGQRLIPVPGLLKENALSSRFDVVVAGPHRGGLPASGLRSRPVFRAHYQE